MGRLTRDAILEELGPSDASLHHHLRFNHYPAIVDGEDFARAAIAAAREGRGDEPLDTGPDVSVPRRAPSAWSVIEAWHLDAFIELEEDGEL